MALAGFNTWKPNEESQAILAAIKEVFQEYKDYLPLTGRQVFYRLVGAYGFPKDERAANKLYGVLGRARRAGLIPFTHLRDGGGQEALPQTFADEDAFWDGVRNDADHYSRNRQTDQETFIELFCEAPGMMPQLQRAAFPYSVPVYGTRGYTGLSVVGQVVRRALERDVPTTILQIGDLDPSGVGIYETLSADVEAFVAQGAGLAHAAAHQNKPGALRLLRNLGVGERRIAELVDNARTHLVLPSAHFFRIALTWEQVEDHGLETAPPSSKDSRSINWPYAETAQAEALPPDLLQQIVRESIEEYTDMDRYQEEVDLEEADKEAIDERLER